MKVSGIYKIQSLIKPERIYIGSAVNIQRRWIDHRKLMTANKHENNINKYGKLDLIFTIIEPCPIELLITREQYYIDTLKPYFNICKIAGSAMGTKRSPESRKRLSERMKGRVSTMKGKHHSIETKEKLRLINLGKKASEETKLKMRLSMLGKNKRECSIETKQKIGNANKGRILSIETRNKMSIARIGNKNGVGNKNHLGHKGGVAWNRGIPHSEKQKQKLKEAWAIRKQRVA